MALIEESYLIHLLNECDAYSTRLEKQFRQSVIKRLDEIYKILKKNIRQSFTNFSLDVIVRFTEIAVQIEQKFQYAEEFVDLFFQRIQAPSQFFIRQLLVKAKVITLKGSKQEQKGQQILKILKSSISYINKALDLISGPQQTVPPKGKDSKGGSDNSKSKYGFLVYNASTCLYKITRFLLRSSWQKNFTDIYERIYKLFEQLDEPSHNWRSRFTFILFQCLYDSDKKADAFKVLDNLWEKTKNKHCDFQDSLFKLRVHLSKENNALAAVIKKDIETNPNLEWGVLQTLQKMKSGAIPETQIEKQMMTVVNTINDGILSSNQQASTILSPIKQERLAEAGRIALKYNIISIASSITNFLSKARQPNQKAMVLNEYNKAELLIKKKGQFIDKKTGMMMSSQQIKTLEVEYRKQALRILEKVMIINKKLDNADLIYEGAILIWNISLPFMCPQYKSFIVNPFEISVTLLEQIDSIDHDLRTKMHLELAKVYFGNQAMFIEVQSNIMKAIKLDPSIPLHKINVKFEPSEDISLYQRPYDRYLEDFREKILLKTMQTLEPGPLDVVMQDLWNVADQKSQTTRIDILQKCLKTLLTMEDPVFSVREEDMLVEEEINEKKVQFERKKLRQYKKKKILAAEVAEFAFEWDLNDFAKKACQIVLADNWDPKNSVQLIIAQSKCCYFMTQIKIDELTNENFEFSFQNLKRINDQDSNQLVEEGKLEQVNKKKTEIIEFFKKGLKLAQSIQQHWLVFNGSIYLWNNCLHVFRNPSNDPELKTQLVSLLQSMLESMKKSLSQIEQKNIVYYDLDTKIQTYANIGLVLARVKELQKKSDQVLRICESLLSASLSPHTRKIINGVKARIQKSSGGASGKITDTKKGGKQPQSKTTSNDAFLLDIITQLQVIQNSTNKTQTENSIKKCFQNLEAWKPKQQDEPQLQLHAELWVRLARLAINQQTINMYKYSIRCCENSLFFLDKNNDLSTIPTTRLRWYSLAEFLYSESLMKICNPQSQEPTSVEKIRFAALGKAVQAAEKGYKCNINILVLDAAKQVWNISAKLQQTQNNRAKLMNPLKNTLFYLKQMKQDSEVDLILLLSELYFKAALENGQFKSGEEITDMILPLVPKPLQKSLWEAKMIFMSKQGKNELHAISSIKQADPSLQAKLWVKLARVSIQPTKQQMAYNKALDILKKQHSVQIVQVLIQYAQWQSRVGAQSLQTIKSTLLLASDYLIDIEFVQDEQQDQPQQQKATVFSRSTRGKKSLVSKSIKSNVKTNNLSKKAPQRKGPLSIKSKGPSSRMNRSGRVTKTAKSKNTKSIFSQKEQDPNPQTLNCLHFQRLFRIHTTLAMIAESVEQRVRYALDAKQFLVKMYHLSIKTLNELLQNAGKFAQNAQKKIAYKSLNYPSLPQDWIKMELSKQFIQRINNFENFNFIGTYTFEKPELTLTYLNHLLDIFDQYGLTIHSLPVNYIARYVSKFILKNDLLYDSFNMKLKRLLSLVNSTFSDDIAVLVNYDALKITQVEFNKQLQKAQNSKVFEKNQNLFFQSSSPPSLVKPISNYQIWTQIGQLLVEQGRLSLGMHFLQKAQIPARILMDNIIRSKILTAQAKINYFSGQFNDSIVKSLQSNKICKSLRIWPDLILTTCQSLLQLRKYQNTKRFLSQVYQTVRDMITQARQSVNNTKSSFQIDLLSLKQLFLFVQLIRCYEVIDEIIEDQASVENVEELIRLGSQLSDSLGKGNSEVKCTVRHGLIFVRICKKLFTLFASGGGHNNIDLNMNIFTTFFQISLKVQKNILQINKYCQITTTTINQNKSTDNFINYLHRQIRYILVQGYIIKEIIKENNIERNSDEEEVEEEGERNDTVDQMTKENDMLRKYLQSLKKQIQLKMKPIPTGLHPCQSATAILQSLKPIINTKTYQFIRWFSYYTLCQTLRAQSKQQLDQVWNEHTNLDQLSGEYAVTSLQTMQQFLQQCESRVFNYQHDPQCYLNAQRSYLALVNNCGMQIPDRAFEFLAKYQHSCYTETLVDMLKHNLNPKYKYVCNERLRINNEFIDRVIGEMLCKNNHVLDGYAKFTDYHQGLAMMPLNSMTIIVQLSRAKNQLYFGCYLNSSIPDEKRFIMKKRDLSKTQFKTLLLIKKSLIKVKKNILKTPFQNSNKISQVINESNNILSMMLKKFEDFNKWWMDEIVELINKPKQSNTDQAQIASKDKDKKASKDPKKKPGAKDQVGAYTSPLQSSPSGIESITFLLDNILYSLPFEHLPGLESVPAISKDNSLFYLTRKLNVVNFQPELNNSNGFGTDKGKFLAYDFKQQTLNFNNILNSVKSPTLKLSGINSSQRVPAPGDLSQYLSTPGYLQVYGNISILNKLKLQTFVNSLNKATNYLILCADNINYRKQVQSKHVDLIQSADIPLEMEEEVLVALLNLLNINMVKLRWNCNEEETVEIIKGWYERLGEGLYVGNLSKTKSTQNKLQENKSKEPPLLFNILATFIHGAPILRI